MASSSSPSATPSPDWTRPTTTSAMASRSGRASTSDGETAAGIDGNMAVSGFSTMTVPPACLTCHAPDEPSDPVPVRITAVSRSP